MQVTQAVVYTSRFIAAKKHMAGIDELIASLSVTKVKTLLSPLV